MASSKTSKWKENCRSAQRLNKLTEAKSQIAYKFSPQRDLSRSSDKLFDKSILQYHSSFDQSIKKSKEEDEKLQNKTIKPSSLFMTLSDANRKTSPQARLPTNTKFKQNKIKIQKHKFEHNKENSNAVFFDLKKQYLSFKKTILLELDRQKQMVQKVIKEVILTLEFEISKISKITNQMAAKQVEKISFESGQSKAIKSIQEWKLALQKTSISEPRVKPLSPSSSYYSPSPTKKMTKHEQSHILAPPLSANEFSSFFGSIDALKRQINDMDKLIELKQPPQHKLKYQG